MNIISNTRFFNGTQYVYEHQSETVGLPMQFSVYVPDACSNGKHPVLFYLSGLTCTWENVTFKAGAQKYAAEQKIIFVCPDTGPRGDEVPDDESYDFGKGAGFYLNATVAPWNKHYRMYDYILSDLLPAVTKELNGDEQRLGITGHSMGGHGALVMAIRNPHIFLSVSAFAPIVAPTQVPWGQKAFRGYLGEDNETAWQDYDASFLIERHVWEKDILIDQGTQDQFLERELRPHIFKAACAAAGVDLVLNMRAGYDHSYAFVASFIENHIKWHSRRLNRNK